MATLKVPATVPAVADDCEQLRKAFQGQSLRSLSHTHPHMRPFFSARCLHFLFPLSLRPQRGWRCECDAIVRSDRAFVSGWGTNEALIISILGHRDAAQRRAIRRAYADTYGEELLRSITDEISGDFEVKPSRHWPSPARAPSELYPSS